MFIERDPWIVSKLERNYYSNCNLNLVDTYQRRSPFFKMFVTKCFMRSIGRNIAMSTRTSCDIAKPTLSKTLDFFIDSNIGWKNVGLFGCLNKFGKMLSNNGFTVQ